MGTSGRYSTPSSPSSIRERIEALFPAGIFCVVTAVVLPPSSFYAAGVPSSGKPARCACFMRVLDARTAVNADSQVKKDSADEVAKVVPALDEGTRLNVMFQFSKLRLRQNRSGRGARRAEREPDLAEIASWAVARQTLLRVVEACAVLLTEGPGAGSLKFSKILPDDWQPVCPNLRKNLLGHSFISCQIGHVGEPIFFQASGAVEPF